MADAHIKLHSSKVGVIDTDQVKQRMAPAARKRFTELLEMLTTPGDPTTRPRSFLSKNDAMLLVQHENAKIVSDASDTTGWCHASSVIEDKPDGQRRRVIFWSQAQNDALYDLGFKSSVNLEHVSAYLDAVRFDAGGTRDLKVGFWQIPLSPRARRALRFTDTEGNVYEPTRLPMGHCVAVDIMQLVTLTIAGDAATVLPGHADPSPAHVWVDGLRFAGTPSQVANALARADKRAAAVGATWKAVTPVQSKYDFIGIDWDHDLHTVKVAEKTASAIRSARLSSMSIHQLEQLVGRLIWAAGATRTALAPFYFAMKMARREANKLDRGEAQPDTVISIPQSVQKIFSAWRTAVAAPLRIVERATPSVKMTLFSDASEKGWGTVLVDNAGAVIGSYGQRWSASEAGRHINALEILALSRAVERFKPSLLKASSLDVRVDNTSLIAAAVKGSSRSEDLTPFVKVLASELKSLDSATRVAYVRSEHNPADALSRGVDVPGPITAAAFAGPTKPSRILRRA